MVFRALAELPAMLRGKPLEVDDNLREVFRSQSMRNLLDVKSWGPRRFASEQAKADKAAAASSGDVEKAAAAAARASAGGEQDLSLGSVSSSSSAVLAALGGGPATANSFSSSTASPPPPPPKTALGRGIQKAKQVIGSPITRGDKAICGIFWSIFAAGILTLFVWGFPKLVDKGIKPAITAVKNNLTPVQIAAVVFFGYVIVPCSFIVGPNSFIWMAGLCFPFWQSVILIECASCVGVLLPFFLGKTVLRRSAARLLARSKPMQVAVRAVDESGPWKVLAIIRLGPVPYAWCNYMCAIPHNVGWFPYLIVSVLCHAPINIMNILFGQNLKGFADLLRGKVNDPIVLAYNVVGIVVIAVFCGLGAWGARRALRSLEAHQREQRAEARAAEAAAAAAVEAKVEALSADGGEGGQIKAVSNGGGGGAVRVVASDASEEEAAVASAAASALAAASAASAAAASAEMALAPALLPRTSEGGPVGGRSGEAMA